MLLETIVRCGAKIDGNFCILQANEVELDLQHTPFQHLGGLVEDLAIRGRTMADRNMKDTKRALSEIDREATKRGATLDSEANGILMTVQIGEDMVSKILQLSTRT